MKLSLNDIERIQIECNNIIEDCFIRVFNKWERQRTVPYTWDTIVKALESPLMGEITLAAEIRQKYNLPYSLPIIIDNDNNILNFL